MFLGGKMNTGKDLWNKYCSFFEKSFSEQVKYNKQRLQEYFEKWKHTKTAQHLCPGGVEKFEDVPLTTYEDYPILHEFGKKIEKLEKTVPREKGELWWDYYNRISKQVVPMLEGWLADEFSLCAKTTGTTGKNKWIVHGKEFWQNSATDMGTAVIFSASDKWGETRMEKGDTCLHLMAPVPYVSGYGFIALQEDFEVFPPPEVVDNISDMRKKIWIALKAIKSGKKVDWVGGIASSLYLACKYFTEPEKLFRDYYQSLNYGLAKLVSLLIWIRYKFGGKKYQKTKEIMPLKGLAIAGLDTKLYREMFKYEFEMEPLNVYAATELGIVMLGRPDRKSDLMPNLRGRYLEFLTESGEIKAIDNLKEGEVYEIVGTPFGSMLMRYKMGDLVRVIDFRNDGEPVFSFESRKSTLIDIYGYFRISEATAIAALERAGLRNTDKWTITKITEPNEQLLLLMEREWGYPENVATSLVFDALQEINEDFHNYVKDFKIKEPSQVIKVEYLKKGAFMRYTMKKVKEGTPLGQIKIPKIIPPDKWELVELLRRV